MATIEMSKMKVGSNVVEIVDQKARDGITQLNADKDELQYVKADVIKCTRTGENIEVTDSANAGFENLKIFGRSEQISTTGKNLVIFKVNNSSIFDAETGTFTSTTTTNTVNQSIKIQMYKDGTSVSYIGEGLGELKTYKLTFKKTNAFNRILVSFNGNMKDSNIIADISHLTDGTTYKIVFTLDSISTNKSSLSGLMIVDESVIDFTYEPYSGGVASPSPDWAQPIKSIGDDGSVDVGVFGKNLLPYPYNTSASTNNGGTFVSQNDGGVSLSGTPTDHSSIVIYDGGKICDGKVLFCMLGIYENCKMSIMLYDNKSTFIFGKEVYRGEYLTVDMHDYENIGRIVVSLVRTSNNVAISGTAYPIIVAGDKLPTKFEKGFAKQSLTAQTTNGLRAIQVTDPTLSTYTDSEGKMWCSDEIDFSRGKYVQRVNVVTYDGVDETWYKTGDQQYGTSIYNVLTTPYTVQDAMCNSFLYDVSSYGYLNNGFSIHNKAINFRCLGVSTLDDWKALLANKPIKVYYILETPIERDLTSAEIAAYKALHTNYPSTVIMNDSGARMEATYHADTFNYVNDHYGESVLYGEQRLSDEQKQQARMNIDSANSIKKTYSGETIVSTESANSWFEGLKVFGRSEQVSTSGKNLLEITESSATINGATFTINDDGSVTVNGTATSTCYFAYSRMDLDVTKKYILSGTTVKSNNNYVYIDNVSPRIADNGDGSITYVENVTRIHVNIRIDPGTYNNLLFKPMIRLATIEDDTYEPYTGGFTSQSPDWVQPIESVGDDGSVDVGVYGKNLFDVEEFVRLVKNLGGYEQTVDNRRCIVFFNSDLYKKDFSSVFSNFKKNTQYTLSLSAKPMNASSVDKSLIVGIFKDNEDSLSSNIASYTQMTFANIGVTTFVNKSVTLPVGSTGKSIGFSYIDYTLWAIDLDSIQLEESPVQTEIDNTPKQSLSIPTPNGLRGIPLGSTIPDVIVSSEKHMRGVWWCEEEQQYYIGDTKEYGRGKNVQRIKTLVFDGVTNKMTGADENYSSRSGNNYAWVPIADKLIGGACIATVGMSNDLYYEEGWTSSIYNDSMSLTLSDERTGITKEDGKAAIFSKINAWLQKNPVTISYLLINPIETDLPSKEISAFKALHSNYPTTTILNDYNAFTEATMMADTKNHIEQNYVPLESYKSLEARVLAVERALA